MPLDPGDERRHDQLRRDVARWDTDGESYAATVARDRQYTMTADGRLMEVVPCSRCGRPVRFAAEAAPTGRDADKVRCEHCRGGRR